MVKVKDSKEGAIRVQNRQSILAAAEVEFALHGFRGTTVQRVADRAGLPKTNVLYYFKSKDGLYLAVLEEILTMWNSAFDKATAQDDPALTLANYIADKMAFSRTKPEASKVFALEIINGAPNLSEFFKVQHTQWMQGRVKVIQQWIIAGKLPATDPYYLLFNIWACCQHYADFSAQITELKGEKMNNSDFIEATKNVITLVLKGCGLVVPQKYR
jgi:TetR/AcrR family transcriptional regulator